MFSNAIHCWQVRGIALLQLCLAVVEEEEHVFCNDLLTCVAVQRQQGQQHSPRPLYLLVENLREQGSTQFSAVGGRASSNWRPHLVVLNSDHSGCFMATTLTSLAQGAQLTPSNGCLS